MTQPGIELRSPWPLENTLPIRTPYFPTYGLNITSNVHWFGCVSFMAYQNFVDFFNAKSIFMEIVLFQTIQFSISTQFKCMYSLIVKNISISSYSVLSSSSNSANSV